MSDLIIPFYKQKSKYLTKSEGCYLFDENNFKYLDLESGDWAANLGHARPEVNNAIKKQVDQIIHDGLQFKSQFAENLSSKLLEKLSFNDGASAFLNSGSEAVNLGITIARNITDRSKVLKMDCSYLSAFGHGHVSNDTGDLINIAIDDLSAIDEIDFSEIALFVFEAGNSGGMIKFPSKKFIRAISKKIKENDGLLMANEVTVGFGRTGKWFGFQHYNYQPDIVAVGKALGNGYPVSGVCITKEINQQFRQNYFRYAQSHQNDPLGCVVGIEVVRLLDKEQLIAKSQLKGNYFLDRLNKMAEKHKSIVSEVRGRGLMLAIDFEPAIDVDLISEMLLEEGYIVGYKDNTMRFMPPLIINKDEIKNFVNCLSSVLENI